MSGGGIVLSQPKTLREVLGPWADGDPEDEYELLDELDPPPAITVHPMRVIAAWSWTDHVLTGILNSFLGSEHEMLSEIIQDLAYRRPQEIVLKRAAEYSLSADLSDLLRRVLQQTSKALERRDWYAHRLWAHVDGIGDALALVKPKDLARVRARDAAVIANHKSWLARISSDASAGKIRWEEFLEAHGTPVPPAPQAVDRNLVFVFTEADFITDLDATLLARSMLLLLHRTLQQKPGQSEQARKILETLLPSPKEPEPRNRTRKRAPRRT